MFLQLDKYWRVVIDTDFEQDLLVGFNLPIQVQFIRVYKERKLDVVSNYVLFVCWMAEQGARIGSYADYFHSSLPTLLHFEPDFAEYVPAILEKFSTYNTFR